MALLPQPFNAALHDPTQSSGSSLPVGKHPVVIESDELKSTTDGQNGMLILNLRIVNGPLMGSTGPYRLNLYHQNAQTSEIAHKQLSAVACVLGVNPQFQDTKLLQGIPFLVEVDWQKGHRPGDEGGKGYTEVKRVFDAQGNEPGKQGQALPAAQPAQQQFQQPTQPVQAQPAPAAATWGQPAAQPPAQQPAAAPPSQPAAVGGWQQPGAAPQMGGAASWQR